MMDFIGFPCFESFGLSLSALDMDLGGISVGRFQWARLGVC